MDEMHRIWLIEMLEREIEETNANISNNAIWANGSEDKCEVESFITNIRSLEDYKQILTNLKGSIEEGKFNV